MTARHCLLLFTFLLLLVPAPALLAQRVQVSGAVYDETNTPLPTVNVTLERNGAIIAGAVTDDRGRYQISDVQAGTYTLFARFIGFQTARARVDIGTERVVQDFHLEPAVLDLEEVEVQASPIQPQEDLSVSLTRVTPAQIRQLPGGAEDVMQTLQMLPGVLASNDFSNRLIIRGGTPDQNLIIFDEIEVFSPYQLSGMGSLLNPAIIREVDLFTGAFPAMYGDRLSSVLAVHTRDGLPDKQLGGQLSTNLVSANLILEGKTGFWDGSWLVSGRQTYFDSFANSFAKRVGVFNEVAFPDFADVQVKLALRPARGHQLRLTGLYSEDVLDLRPETSDFGQQGESNNLLRGDVRGRNAALGLTWTYVPSARTQVKLLANWYRNEGESDLAGGLIAQGDGTNERRSRFTDPPKLPVFGGADTLRFAYDQTYALEKATVGGQFLFTTGRHTFEVGGGADFLRNGLDLGLDLNEFGALVFDAFQATNPLMEALVDSIDAAKRYDRYQFYVQDKIATPLGEVFLQPSLRYDYYGIIGKGYVSPRLGLSFILDEATTVRFAGGRYVQSPGFEKLLDQENLFNLARFNSLNNLQVEEALHLGGSVSRRFGEAWHVKIDGYWKQLDNLIIQASREVTRPVARYVSTGEGRLSLQSYRVTSAEVFTLTNDPVNAGSGKAAGMELLVEKRATPTSDAWSGWFSYAYAEAVREQVVAGEEVRFPFDYDRRHTLNLTLNRRLGNHFNVGLTWRFGTGFPYTPPVSMEPLVAVVDDPQTNTTRGAVLTDPATGNVWLVPGFGEVTNINSARLPDYHRLDMRVTYATQGRGMSFEVYLDLINLYNRKNVISYQYIVEVVEDTRNVPLALQKPPAPVLFREPVYMFPFIPSVGFSLSF
ncbi:MAG: carboxypeptidase-like regulatory domain-containing protein [Rhodothermales bacterium]